MKNVLILCMLLCVTCQGMGQEIDDRREFRLALTIEPLNFISKGYSISLAFKYKKLEAGITTFSSYSKKNVLFKESDQLDIKLRNGTAFFARFYPLNLKSGPFIGFLVGEESWRVRKRGESTGGNIIRNEFFTPQLGYQWVTLNDHLVINPSVRFILPFDIKGAETTSGVSNELKKIGIIPSLDLGFGLNWNE